MFDGGAAHGRNGAAHAPAADACSLVPSFTVTAEHLRAGDFNASDSQLAQDYRSWTGDETAEI